MRAPAKKAPSRKSVPSDIELDIFFKKDGLYYDSEKCNVLIYVDKNCPESCCFKKYRKYSNKYF